MARKRMLDDKATWMTDKWGIDPTQPARAERVFDPNDAVTDDSSPGSGIGGGTSFGKRQIQQKGQMYTDQMSDLSQAVRKAYTQS